MKYVLVIFLLNIFVASLSVELIMSAVKNRYAKFF